MTAQILDATAQAMVADGKGLLAADESTATITKRLDTIDVEGDTTTSGTARADSETVVALLIEAVEHAVHLLVDVNLGPTGIAIGVEVVDDDNVQPAVHVVVTEERVSGDVSAGEPRDDA